MTISNIAARLHSPGLSSNASLVDKISMLIECLSRQNDGTEMQQAASRAARNAFDAAVEAEGTLADLLARMLELESAGTLDDAMTAEVQALGCGDVVFTGLSSEAFTRLGRIFRDAVPQRHLLIAGTCNGVLGYLGTPEDARGQGYASGAAARIYGMAPPTPEGGVQWAREGAEVVRHAAGLATD